MRSALECVSAWSSAMAAQDSDAMNELLHQDFKLIEPEGLSYRGVYEGQSGWWAFWDNFGKTWTDISIADQKVFAGQSHEECAIMMNLSGRSVKSGKAFQTSLMEYWRFKDGKILEMHPHYRDTQYLSKVEGELT